MLISSTGGIFLRIDSNSNLGIFDQAGTERVQIISGISSVLGNVVTGSQSSNINTTSLTFVSSASGVAFKPQQAGRALVIASAQVFNNTAGDGAGFAIYRTTGAIPTQGSAVTGTLITSGVFTSLAGGTQGTISLVALDTGLTNGTSYNYYLAWEALGAGTATLAGGGQAAIVVVTEF